MDEDGMQQLAVGRSTWVATVAPWPGPPITRSTFAESL